MNKQKKKKKNRCCRYSRSQYVCMCVYTNVRTEKESKTLISMKDRINS